MKKMFVEELPRKYGIGANKNKIVINWKESIGHRVKFIYDDVEGEIEIVDYYKENNQFYINIKYKNNISKIKPCNFTRCKLGDILNIKTSNYKYEIGDIITDIRSGKLQILEQTRIGKKKSKGYKYKCLICGNEDTIVEYSLTNKAGCSVCSNKKILKGYNDIATINKKLFNLLANPEDGYKYPQSSSKKVDWKCPNCGNIIKHKRISDINIKGLSCPQCGDGISYPEKIMYQVLKELDINFIYQLSKVNFKWCDIYKYDFYIPKYNIIIETHGMGHYEKGFQTIVKSKRARTLEQEQENDELKKKLAIKNGIKPENYIIIDCRYSTLKWIKEHILQSRLSEIFDLSKIDWRQCEKNACNSLVKKACNYWNNNIRNTIEIGKIMKMNCATINKYLKRGTKLNWCNYNPKEEMRKNGLKYGGQLKKQIICLNTNKVFDSIFNAQKYYNLRSDCGIIMCCQNKRNYAGVDLKTKKYLQWQYYNNYLINPKKLLSNKEIDVLSINSKKSVICLNNNKVFDSISKASDYMDISRNCIKHCCENKTKYAGVDLKIKINLQWQYYDEYLVNPKKLLSNEEVKINKNKKKVICLNNNIIFNSVEEAKNYYNIKHISECCNNKYKSCGKDPITGEKLRWMYYEDYLKLESENKIVNE